MICVSNGNERNREVLFRTQRFSRALYAALDRVTVANMQRALAEELGTPYEILTPAEISAVVARRAVVQRYIADLIAQHPHVAAKGRAADRILGLAAADTEQFGRISDREAQHPHPASFGHREVARLVDKNQRAENNDCGNN